MAIGRMPKPGVSSPMRSRSRSHIARVAREERRSVSPNGQPWTKLPRRGKPFPYFRVIFTRAPFNAGGKSEKKFKHTSALKRARGTITLFQLVRLLLTS